MRIDFSKENIFARMRLPGSPLQLAVFRIALGLQVAYSASSRLLDLLQVVDGTSKPTVFPSWADVFIASIAVPYLQWATIILGLLLAVGLFTRWVAPLLFVFSLLLFSFWYSRFDAPVPWLYLWFPLLVLSFSRSADRLSLDSVLGMGSSSEGQSVNTYRWPVELVRGWFAYIYVAAGVAKILPIVKGLHWLDGGTSHRIIYDRYLDSFLYYIGLPPFFDYSEGALLFSVLSIGSILVELSCLLIFFTDRFNHLVLFLIFSMHFFLYAVGVPGFMQLALVLAVCVMRVPSKFIK